MPDLPITTVVDRPIESYEAVQITATMSPDMLDAVASWADTSLMFLSESVWGSPAVQDIQGVVMFVTDWAGNSYKTYPGYWIVKSGLGCQAMPSDVFALRFQ